MQHESRSEPRYFVVTPLAAELDHVNADLIDISSRGARLQVTQKMEAGRPMPFSMRTAETTIETAATVVWCDVAALSLSDEESDRYFCGISFVQSLAPIGHVIDELLAARSAIRIEENRAAERYRVIAPLTASFSEHASLRVLDLSLRGARLSTPSLLKPGTSGRLRFTINGNDTHVWLPASVMWSRPAQRKGRFEAGLRIADAEDWLRTVIDELSLRDGVVIDTDGLRRKFDPFVTRPVSGCVAVMR